MRVRRGTCEGCHRSVWIGEHIMVDVSSEDRRSGGNVGVFAGSVESAGGLFGELTFARAPFPGGLASHPWHCVAAPRIDFARYDEMMKGKR